MREADHVARLEFMLLLGFFVSHPNVLVRVRVAGICGTALCHWKKHEPELACKIVSRELAGEALTVQSILSSIW